MFEILLQLFWEFFKIGLFSVGGGLATLPFLYDIAKRYDWFLESQMGDMIAISEATPGPIGVNMATYAGFNAAGIPGAVIATFALALPATVLLMLIAAALKKFNENKLVKNAFYGLRPAVVGLIGAAAVSLFSISLVQPQLNGLQLTLNTDLLTLAFFAVTLFLSLKYKKIHPVIFIAVGAVMGIVFKIGL